MKRISRVAVERPMTIQEVILMVMAKRLMWIESSWVWGIRTGNNQPGSVMYEVWRRHGDTVDWYFLKVTKKQRATDTPVTPGQYYELQGPRRLVKWRHVRLDNIHVSRGVTIEGGLEHVVCAATGISI